MAQQASMDTAIKNLGSLKQGTDAYKNAVVGMLNQYPALRAYGINSASSIDAIRKAANQSNLALVNLTNRQREAAREQAVRSVAKNVVDILDPRGRLLEGNEGLLARARAAAEAVKTVAEFQTIIWDHANTKRVDEF
jgi:hypothetical protein